MIYENLSIFASLNPWWSTGEVPSSWTGLKRDNYLIPILKWIDDDFIQVISGIRRCGKTTIIYQVIDSLIRDKKYDTNNILFINCDDIKTREKFRYLKDIAEIFETIRSGDKLIVFDEIQYYDDWEQQCKNLYDTFRGRIKFIISGSSAVLSTSKNLHFLTGRMMPTKISPFTFEEFLVVRGFSSLKLSGQFDEDHKNLAMLNLENLAFEYMEFGGFPKIVLSSVDKKRQIANEYFDEVIYKDIVKLWEIKDVKNLEKVALFLVQNAGQRFSYRKIAESVEENKNTTQNYLQYIEQSHLIKLVEYYSKSTSQQFKKEKKIALIDPVFHTSRFGCAKLGTLAENCVYSNLSKRDFKIFYWKNKYEVDFVIEDSNQKIIPIEVKYQNEIKSEDFRGIYSFLKHFEKTKYAIIVTKNKFEKIRTKDDKIIWLIPMWLFLLSF